MTEFIDELITYIDSRFNGITIFEKKPKGHYAYEKGLIPSATTPFYTIQILDDQTDIEDFGSERASQLTIQINLYGVKMKMDGVLTDAQHISLALAHVCKEFMLEFKYTNEKVIKMRQIGGSPALPYEDGSKAYYSVLRYNITTNNDKGGK